MTEIDHHVSVPGCGHGYVEGMLMGVFIAMFVGALKGLFMDMFDF